jgi:hypothetical protein
VSFVVVHFVVVSDDGADRWAGIRVCMDADAPELHASSASGFESAQPRNRAMTLGLNARAHEGM